tara:strand:+ start:2276 stop:3382 length:1107 start_codon:yes stop_codon:yes gene_type:complete
MASSFKQIKPSDRVSTRTLLHEAIPLTGTIVSGTYSDENIKNYSHGMFQSVYDYPYLSSSANHIFDITAGYANGSVLSGSSNDQNSKKINIYTEMSQMLVGYDVTGSVLDFDEDGNLLAGGAKLKECLFVNFSRLLYKDEIKKGTFSLELGMSSSYTENGEVMYDRLLVTDYSGSDGYLVNSPLGEYGVLYVTASTNRAGVRILANDPITTNRPPCGLIYYQAGVAVLSSSLFLKSPAGLLTYNVSCSGPTNTFETFTAVLSGSSITGSADNLRTRLYNLQFNNTVELNSTIYFCRANHNEFNYSGNPTYLSSSQIRVKDVSTDAPISYITTVGLYSENNELLAVGKLSEPLKKSTANEFTIRTRLDY